jgi:hypothetical protein
MKEKQIKRWKILRENGKGNYIIRDCILRSGIPTGIISFISYEILFNGMSKFDLTLLLGTVIAGALFGIIYGGIVGLVTWKINEKSFKNIEEEEKNIQ